MALCLITNLPETHDATFAHMAIVRSPTVSQMMMRMKRNKRSGADALICTALIWPAGTVLIILVERKRNLCEEEKVSI